LIYEPVRPTVAIRKDVFDIIERLRKPREHVSQGGGVKHTFAGELFGLVEGFEKGRRGKAMLFVELAAKNNEMHYRKDRGAFIVIFLNFFEVWKQAFHMWDTTKARRRISADGSIHVAVFEKLA
jgi:hypothetical protein